MGGRWAGQALLTQVCVEAKAYESVLLAADPGEGGVAYMCVLY